MREYVISGSLVAAREFAHRMGWRPGDGIRSFYNAHGLVLFIDSVAEFDQMRPESIIHVGLFNRSTVDQALKRHLSNIAEARGHHLVEYDTTLDRPVAIRICLVCGGDRPCLSKADLEPGEPGIPCTFDPSPYQLMKRIRELETENRRLSNGVKQSLQAALECARMIKSLSDEVDRLEHFLKTYRSTGYGNGTFKLRDPGST